MEGWKEPKLEVSPWLIIAETAAWAAGKEGEAGKEERGWNMHKIWFWIADLRPGFWWCFYTWVIKRKGFTRWQEAASHLFPPRKNCRSVLHPCIALPFSTWSRQWLSQLKGEKQFIYITNTFMLGNTRLWDKVEGILCFIGDWNREKCFLLN